VSWRILLSELEQSYRGEELPPVGTSYVSWARLLEEESHSARTQEEAAYWSAVLERRGWDLGRLAVTAAEPVSEEVTLPAAQTRALLEQAPAAYRTQINDLLLAALGEALCEWSGQASVLVDVEGHGRQEVFPEVDLSRTVGWFTTLYPVALEKREGEGKGELLRRVKEQLRGVPREGLGWGLRGQSSPAPVRFNYLGQLDGVLLEGGLLRVAGEGSGPSQHPEDERPYAVDVVAQVSGGRMRTRFSSRGGVGGVHELARRYQDTLQELIGHCLKPQVGGYTVSDFPRSGLSQEDLDALLGSERGVEDVYPLSPLQQGLLFHTLYAPQSAVYFEQLSCRMEGALEVEAFRAAWQEVVRRHPILRTGFEWEGLGQPVQVVRRQVELEWEQEDWSGYGEQEVESRLQELLEEDRRRGFDLRRGPLMRVRLLRLAGQRHQLVWSNHHLILDGWSRGLLIEELFTLYEAARAGTAARLATPRPFRSYIDWLAAQDLSRARDFWRQELAGFTSPTPLGVPSRTDAAAAAHDYGELWSSLPSDVVTGLDAFAARHHLTLATLFRALWSLTVGALSGRRDVVFGAVVSARPPELPGVEAIVGLLIGTLPVRVRLPEQGSTVAWLAGLQASQTAARCFEHTPLASIRKLSSLPPGLPMFESLLVFQNYPRMSRGLPGIDLGDLQFHIREGYPLVLTAAPQAGGSLGLRYQRARFDDAAIAGLMATLHRLARRLAAAGSVPDLAELCALAADADAAGGGDRKFSAQPAAGHDLLFH
jgi:non-ribosomal peptide synthase protein (TIGR01720 family)